MTQATVNPYAGRMTFSNPWGAVFAIIARKDKNDKNAVLKQQVIDLTPLITGMNVKLREDGGHSWTMQVVNPRGTILPLLRPGDLIIITGGKHAGTGGDGKQILTGYIDRVPWDTEFKADPLTISGFCTLYRAMTRYFDPYLPQFMSVPNSTPDQILRLIATDPQFGGYKDEDVIIQPLGAMVRNRWLASIQSRLSNQATGNNAQQNVSVSGGAQLAFVQDNSVTVKHAKASVDQKTNMAIILGVGIEHGASDKALQAAIMAGTQESSFTNDARSHDGAGSLGIYQITAAHHVPDSKRMDPKYNGEQFFLKGFTGAGGAIALAKGSRTPGQVCQAVEGSNFPDAYNQWETEAAQTLATFKKHVDGSGGAQVTNTQASQQDTVGGTTVTTKWAWPTSPKGTVGQKPGEGTHSFTNPPNNWESDNAIDIMVARGSSLIAVNDGTIQRIVHHSTDPALVINAGNTIYLKTKDGVNCVYLHVLELNVSEGEHVTKGQKIGTSGTANHADHLHFAVETSDPLALLDGSAVADVGSIGTDMPQQELQSIYTLDTFEQEAFRVKYERMDDITVMNYLQKVASWGFYKLQTDGNGKLCAYVPDYLAKKPTFILSDMDIEHYLPIPWSLNDLKTHVYVKGQLNVFTPSSIQDWKLLIGASTIYDPINYRLLLNEPLFADFKDELRQRIKEKYSRNPTAQDWVTEQQSIDPTGRVTLVIDKIIAKFGARPLLPFIEEPYLRTFEQVQLEADFKFQEAWFNRYRATITATFQPDLRPGHTVYLPSHGRMFYVEEVSHTMFSGWTTELTLKAGRTRALDKNDPDELPIER